MQTEINLALITALISIAIAVISGLFALRNQKSLSKFNSRLDEQRAEKDARRDYIYDARKRLYNECEPLFFLLNEMSENALYRICGLARTAREGNLDSESGWLSGEGYYLKSTLYKLLAPLTIFKLMQQRLTLVDLSVDPNVKTRYDLIKQVYITFTDDFELAKIEPNLPYNPEISNWAEKRRSEPDQYWKQGIYTGLLDSAVESLIVKESPNLRRCMSFGEFEKSYAEQESTVHKTFGVVKDIFLKFHPKTRPVLWRILVTQIYLYLAITLACNIKESNLSNDLQPIREIPKTQRKDFDWRSSVQEESDEKVLIQPFEVAKKYIENNLKQYYKWE